MKRMLHFAAALLVTTWLAGTSASASAEGSMTLCIVCQVTKGEAGEEPVKAVRTYEGKSYGFCSDKCAKAFDADPVAYLPPVFPRPVPSFALTDLGGRTLSPATLAGKVALLDFWATWCMPCRKSMPELQALHDKYAGRGFTVVGISIDESGVDKVRKFVASKKFTYPIAVDIAKNPAWGAFGVKALPAAYLVNRDGQIVAQWTGLPPSSEALEQKLQELLKSD